MEDAPQDEKGIRDDTGSPYYTGRVVGFSSMRGVGLIRAESGREVPFDLRFCAVAGAPSGLRARGFLDVGLRVAYDVGWTSSGLRATWLKPLGALPETSASGATEAEAGGRSEG